jgi:hypothetical protein
MIQLIAFYSVLWRITQGLERADLPQLAERFGGLDLPRLLSVAKQQWLA